jgi:actin-related protein
MYCGDETASFIGDIGSHTCRFGYGGEDNPKMVVSSYVNMHHRSLVPSCLSSLKKNGTGGSASSSYNDPIQSILRRPTCSRGPSQHEGSLNDEMNTKMNNLQPIVNPDEFLQQGEAITNWEALDVAWHAGMNTLRAKDTLKHTKGGTPYTLTTQTHAGLVASTTIPSTTTAMAAGDGKCVHPLLAITPGMTHSGSGTGDRYGAALQRHQYIQYTEFIMESLEASSMFLAPTPMLAAFSHGRQTALVVDVGAGGTRVTPVLDGLVLHHSQRRSGRGGDWLDHVTWRAMMEYKDSGTKNSSNESTQGMSPSSSSSTSTILPRYQIRQQRQRDYNTTSFLCSPLYHQWAMQDLMYEFRSSPHMTLSPLDPTDWDGFRTPFTSTTTTTTTTSSSDSSKATTVPATPSSPMRVSPSKDPDGSKQSTPQKSSKDEDGDVNMDTMPESSADSSHALPPSSANHCYVLPDGTQIDLSSSPSNSSIGGQDFCRIPELLFTETIPFSTTSSLSPSSLHYHTLSRAPIHQLIRESLLAVGDVDVRKELASHILVTGGASVVDQFEVRLSSHVSNLIPTLACKQPKVIASRHNIERSCAGWIGASILTSLGSFQQLWLSRTEYEEYGATLACQRFP